MATFISVPLVLFFSFALIVSYLLWFIKYKSKTNQTSITKLSNPKNKNIQNSLKHFKCFNCLQRQSIINPVASSIIAQEDLARNFRIEPFQNTLDKMNTFDYLSSSPTDCKHNSRLMNMEKGKMIMNGSHVTLGSHLEENKWDYNLATRGLYFNQPWVKGQYGSIFTNEGADRSEDINNTEPYKDGNSETRTIAQKSISNLNSSTNRSVLC